MAMLEIEMTSEKATLQVGRLLGELLAKQSVGKEAMVLALHGELGAGKTTFIRGLAKGLGIREKITSPSFLIAKRYEIPRRTHQRINSKTQQYAALWHFDFYRFHGSASKRDLELLNFAEIIRDPRNIVAIEWAERVLRFLPAKRLILHFTVLAPEARKLVVSEVQMSKLK